VRPSNSRGIAGCDFGTDTLLCVAAASVRGFHRELRDNVLGTLLGEYRRTGYFWEQYDDATGQGLRSHPFTGWTGLVLNIMAEMY
jgi:hypothetical protein